MKYIVSFLLAILAFNLSVDAQRKKITAEDSVARSLSPIADQAIVYILRPGRYINPAMQITCNGNQVGITYEQTYLFTIIAPGTYTFTSSAENQSKLDITLEAGKIYYVEQQIKYGLAEARAHLVPVDEAKGKKFIEKCKLSKDNVYKFE